jgi:hypothetical protein
MLGRRPQQRHRLADGLVQVRVVAHRTTTLRDSTENESLRRQSIGARLLGGLAQAAGRDGLRRPLVGGALAQPGGPFLALTFADPAYPGPQQAEDLFLFDTRNGALTHVPGFPAQIDLKFSSMSWTHDGRLVLLLHAAGTTTLGVYRPGGRAVSLRRVRLPVRNSGSAAFVPIVSTRSRPG